MYKLLTHITGLLTQSSEFHGGVTRLGHALVESVSVHICNITLIFNRIFIIFFI